MRGGAAGALFGVLVLVGAAGCGGRPQGLVAVRAGMSKKEVKHAAGMPLRRETGDFARIGRDVWHYSDGEVHFYMHKVSKVRRFGQPVPRRKSWERKRQPWEMD